MVPKDEAGISRRILKRDLFTRGFRGLSNGSGPSQKP